MEKDQEDEPGFRFRDPASKTKLELIGGSCSDDLSSNPWHLATNTSKATTSSHQALLAHVGDSLPDGISPNHGIPPDTTKRTSNLELLSTKKRRSLPQPAILAAGIQDRAGNDLAKPLDASLFASLKQWEKKSREPCSTSICAS